MALAAVIILCNITGLCEPPVMQALEYLESQPPPQVIMLEPQRSGHSENGSKQWKTLLEQYFPAASVETMLCLIDHESRGNPNAVNPTSGAAGLLQIMPFWWEHYGGNPFDPEANIKVASYIYQQQGFQAWSPYNRGHCQ